MKLLGALIISLSLVSLSFAAGDFTGAETSVKQIMTSKISDALDPSVPFKIGSTVNGYDAGTWFYFYGDSIDERKAVAATLLSAISSGHRIVISGTDKTVEKLSIVVD